MTSSAVLKFLSTFDDFKIIDRGAFTDLKVRTSVKTYGSRRVRLWKEYKLELVETTGKKEDVKLSIDLSNIFNIRFVHWKKELTLFNSKGDVVETICLKGKNSMESA